MDMDRSIILFTSEYRTYTTMLFDILVFIFYFATYTILLAIGGLWCFEECAPTEEEEYEFQHQQQRLMLY